MKKLFILCLMSFLAVSVFGQEQVQDWSQNFAFLSLVRGRVLLQEEQAQQNQYVLKGDWLLIEKGARAEVRFGEQGGYISIDENSKLFFVAVSPEKSVIALFQGAVYLRHLEGVELRAESKSEGKVIVPQKDQIIRVDIADGKVEVDENPYLRDGFDSFNQKREKETVGEIAKPEKEQRASIYTDYYPYSYYWPYYWRVYGLYFGWYPGWYPMYYYFSNYGYYGYYNYYQNQYGYGYGGNYQNYSGRRVVNRSQLQNRQIIARPSRMNSRSTTTSSFRPFSSTSRIQSRPTSSYRAPQSSSGSRSTAVSRGSSSSRGLSSSGSRPTSSGSIRRK